MAEEQLHKKLTTGATFLGGEDFYQKKVPEYIFQNLKENFGQRPYQKEAFGRFIYYWEDYPRSSNRSAHTTALPHGVSGKQACRKIALAPELRLALRCGALEERLNAKKIFLKIDNLKVNISK